MDAGQEKDPLSRLLSQWQVEASEPDASFPEAVWRKIALAQGRWESAPRKRRLAELRPAAAVLALLAVAVGGLGIGGTLGKRAREKELAQSFEEYLTLVNPYRLAAKQKP
jgi:hypothetical protein